MCVRVQAVCVVHASLCGFAVFPSRREFLCALQVNGQSVIGMPHNKAVAVIKAAKENVKIVISRSVSSLRRTQNIHICLLHTKGSMRWFFQSLTVLGARMLVFVVV